MHPYYVLQDAGPKVANFSWLLATSPNIEYLDSLELIATWLFPAVTRRHKEEIISTPPMTASLL